MCIVKSFEMISNEVSVANHFNSQALWVVPFTWYEWHLPMWIVCYVFVQYKN